MNELDEKEANLERKKQNRDSYSYSKLKNLSRPHAASLSGIGRIHLPPKQFHQSKSLVQNGNAPKSDLVEINNEILGSSKLLRHIQNKQSTTHPKYGINNIVEGDCSLPSNIWKAIGQNHARKELHKGLSEILIQKEQNILKSNPPITRSIQSIYIYIYIYI